MVNIHVNDKKNQVKINVSPTSNSVSSTIGNETFYNGLAKEWAISPELVQGEDYSAKYYAGQAKQAEQTATEAISHIGTSVEDAAGYAQSASDSADAAALSAQSAQSSAEYVVNNAPTVTVEQTATGAIVTATDLQGTTTATILNGAKGDKGDTGEQGIQGIQGEKGDTGFSPTATVSKSGKVSTLTVTDLNGTTTTEILDGADSGYTLPIASSNTLGGVKIGNNLSIDANGVLSAATGGTVDQTYNGNSANAQSGVAINGAGFLQNTATGNSSITVNGTATAKSQAINIGTGSQATGNYSTALGTYSFGNASHALGIGNYAKATADYAIQLNKGTNNTSNSLCVGFNSDNYQLLDGTTGLIPDARLSSNIARTSDLPTNYVTTDTDQNITGTKTFVGQKKIAFKQSGTSDKLGFTLYNNSGTEKGYLEYNPSNTVDSVPLMTLGNYATASGGLTHVGFRKYSSISGASGAYNLLTPLISDAKTPFSLTTTYTNFYLPLGFTDGTTTVKTAKSGMVDLSSIIPTATSDLTNDSGFITSSAISDMQTTTNLVTSISDTSTDTQYPSAKCVYDEIQTAKRNIGEIVQSTLPLTDAGLHLLDGTLLQYGIYQEFIDYIADLYAENPTANYFTDETTWQASVTQYGSCGKFVYDSTNNTVRLPKVSDILQSTTDINALGNLIEAGLPNITGNTAREIKSSSTNVPTTEWYGSMGYQTVNSGSYGGSGTTYRTAFLYLDASKSSPIYGNSTTVQPQTIKAFVYIVIANSTKTSIQVDIDEIATDLNNKAGTDLANVTDTGKILMSEMGMPSDSYIDLTLGASGSTYTAPANGWLIFAKAATSADQWITINNLANDISVGYNCHASGNIPRGYLPCKKGDVIRVQYNLGGAVDRFRFIYAQGSESEFV